jgi:hypothetical protein
VLGLLVRLDLAARLIPNIVDTLKRERAEGNCINYTNVAY